MMMMMMMNQQANNDHMSKALNPAAEPFSPLHRNHYPNLSSLPHYNTYAAAPPFTPMLYQPHILPVSECYYQQCPGEYITTGQVFVHPSQPQPQHYAANLYNPMQQDHFGASRPISFVAPQVFGPAAPCLVPNMGCHFFNYGAPLASTLRENIVNQIEYYFSNENLEQDNYLISLMDDKGWVPISTIAGFNRIKAMCKSIPFILDSLFDSNTVERHGNKIRRRDGWSKWISSSGITKQKIKVSPLEQIPMSGVSILTTLATPQVEVDTASNEYVDKIVNNELSEPLTLDDLSEARVDMVEENGCLESSSPKYFEKAQPSRSLLDVEFVRAYLAKGDEVLKNDRFSYFRPRAQKKKIKELINTKSKPFQVSLLGRCPTRNRTRTTLLHLQYMRA
ncbi:hypothetical protein M0R45_022133 [Rubus argutus]|uniref:HTH La-type RNA-binding domain-containing protein n=1 Tax=Rubus argutus TaxID=59490 RepID=A0AAW1XFJ8_RUBAR